MPSNPLNDIEFEKINDEYVYGHYANFDVIMMKKNGYINATKMCQDISDVINKKKQFVDWKRTQCATELLDELIDVTGIPVTSMTKVVQTSDPKMAIIRGTYVHPDLIPHIASWASPKFAVKVSKIVNEYFNSKERRKHQRELCEKNDKIDELMKKLDKQHAESQEKIDRLLHKNKKVSRKLTVVKEHAEDLSNKLTDVQEQNDKLLDKIDKISEDRVVNAPDDMDKHVFIVMRDDSDEAERSKKYYAIRTKRRTSKTAIKKYRLEHTDSTILINIEYNPNSINLWDRVRAKLSKKIRIRVNYFGLKSGYTEHQLKEDIGNINDEKYDD